MNILKTKIFSNKSLKILTGLKTDVTEMSEITIKIKRILIVDRIIYLAIIDTQEEILDELVSRLGEDEGSLRRDITIRMMMIFHNWAREQSEMVYIRGGYFNPVIYEPIRIIIETYNQRR